MRWVPEFRPGCWHCGGAATHERHVCEMAVLDWVNLLDRHEGLAGGQTVAEVMRRQQAALGPVPEPVKVTRHPYARGGYKPWMR